MLTVIQPPLSWAALAPVALVPFILACRSTAKTGRLFLIAYLISLCYWLGNLYWIFPITWLGWLTFCLYTALLWPALVVALRLCGKIKIPLFLAVPVLFVGAERLQGLFLDGFYWRLLAHSQYANITLIQIADIFGAAGVSFLIAMVNGLIAELIIAASQKRFFKITLALKTALVCAAAISAIIYGRWRINQSDDFIEAGPLVASLQSNVPQSVKDSSQASETIFNDLLQNSNLAADAGAQLILWPETMVQTILDKQVWPFLLSSKSNETFDKALSEHSKNKAFVLVGAPGGWVRQEKDLDVSLDRFNSAFLYTPNGRQAKQKYNKIHLVPFGEVVPFKKTVPWIHKLMMKFTPYDYDYTLDYGSDYTVFEMTTDEHIYNFGVMICYEGTIPCIARRFATDQAGRKRLHWLVNISNDGWFVRFNNGKIIPGTELEQHTVAYVFRAVENRLSIIRSVNTGISCLVDSLGRIRNGYIEAAPGFPAKALERKGIAGWFMDKMPIDKRRTFFNKYGQWLDISCAVILAILIITAASQRLFFTKNKG